MGAIGNMDAYMKFKAQAWAMRYSRRGGGAAGHRPRRRLGMGMGMAGMISNAMASGQGAQQSAPQPASGVPSVMTLEEAAAYLKVSTADVEALIESGELKARRIGSQVRISKEAIDAFLAG